MRFKSISKFKKLTGMTKKELKKYVHNLKKSSTFEIVSNKITELTENGFWLSINDEKRTAKDLIRGSFNFETTKEGFFFWWLISQRSK